MANRKGISFSQRYSEILDSDAFVDKSMLIKQFFESNLDHVVYHGPSGFGKSVNIDMLQTFAAIEVEKSNGRIIKPESTDKYAKFTSEKLAIRHEKNIFNNHFAQYPIITFDFNQLVCSSHEEFLIEFSRQLSREFRKYNYLSDHGNGSLFISRAFEKYVLPTTSMEEAEIQGGAAILAQVLYKHFGRKCIVFIDEYDGPLVNALLDVNYPEADIKKTINFLLQFLRSLVKEIGGHVKRSFITGITRFGGTYTSEINNLEHIRFLDDPEIAPLYGFTHGEVENLTKQFLIEDTMDNITEFYGNFNSKESGSFFCPYSICKFLNNRKLGDYWKPLSSHMEIIFRYDALGPYIENSISGTPVTILNKLQKSDFLRLRNYIKSIMNGEKCDDLTVRNLVMNYLYDSGIYRSKDPVDPMEGERSVSIYVSNVEVQRYLLGLIYTPDYFKLKYQLSEDVRQTFLDSACNIANHPKNFELLRDSINKLLLNCKPVPDKEKGMQRAIIGAIETDTSGSFRYSNIEDIIHGVPKLKKTIKNKSNKVEEGDKMEDEDDILDGIFVTLLLIGVIMEFKHTGEDERYSKKSSRQALQQIFDRKYDLIFAQKPILKEVTPTARVYIGVHFDQRTRTTSLSYCWNTQNMNEAVHI